MVSAARSKKKKGPGDKKVAGQAMMPKTELKKLDSDVLSDQPEYVITAKCRSTASVLFFRF